LGGKGELVLVKTFALVEKDEALRNERAKYLLELAQLKNIPLSQLLEYMGLNSAIGRATVELLQLNRDSNINLLRLLAKAGLHPPKHD
jgi:hypothetical protein